jgi:pyruvate/2-oxoglutarate dehydrogenase complex dihydrolipoamide acyltransferase (E2) component
MPKIVDVYAPRIDPSVETVTIVEWKKDVGSTVNKDEELVTLMGEKAQFDLKSPCKGKLIKINYQKGQEVSVGSVIAQIECEE